MNIYNNKKKDKEYKNIMKILENLQCIINRYPIFENIKIKMIIKIPGFVKN